MSAVRKGSGMLRLHLVVPSVKVGGMTPGMLAGVDLVGVLGAAGGWILCFPLGYGAVGLWWGLALGLIVTGTALVWRLMVRTRVHCPRAGES